MCVRSPEPLPYFWHVWCWGDHIVDVARSLAHDEFGYLGNCIWYHRKKHAMFLWQLKNSEFVAKPGIKIKEYQFNVRQHKSRKSKKNS